MSTTNRNPLFLKIWIALLAITAVEVLLAYVQLGLALMLALLIGLSALKAQMIMSYFMHLKFDRPLLKMIIIPPILFLLVVMMAYLFPDSFLILES